MQILSNKIKPNFEEFNKVFTANKIVNKFKGNEMHKFMNQLYNNKLKVVIKPQHVEHLVKYLTFKKIDPDVKNYLFQNSDYESDSEIYQSVIKNLDLNHILNNCVKTLSGGELQRLVCALVILRKADVYILMNQQIFLILNND